MKILAVFICLFLSVPAFSQIRDAASIFPDSNKRPSIIINYSVFVDSLNDAAIDSMLIINVLKGVSAQALYGIRAINGVTIVVTKQYATNFYQNNLSFFSKRYRKYLKTFQGNDTRCLYVLNDKPITGERIDVIRKLYAIPANKIKSVNCSKNPDFRADDKAELVAITTVNH